MKTRLNLTKCLAIGVMMGLAAAGTGLAQNQTIEEAPLVDGLKDLKTLNRQLVEMAQRSSAATVSLVSRGGGGAGSGVIVSEDGLILTAAHVVAALSDEVIVIFPDGTRKPAKQLGADFDRDAAMVKITEKGSYPFAELGESGGLKRNQWCVALGHPGGFDPNRTPPIRLGRVLRVGGFVVTDCAVVGGDSGGPLFDVEGRVIGIHSNIGATLSENRHVPVDVYRDQWDSMKKGERSGKRFAGRQGWDNPNRPMLGVVLGEPGEDGGVFLQDVIDGSPAAKAGLVPGDLVLTVNGKKTDSAEQLIKAVSAFKPGKTVKVALERDGEEQEVQVKLARLKDLEEEKEAPNGKDGAPAEDTPKTEPEKGGKADAGARDASAEAMKKMLEEALKNDGRLELTPEKLDQFGGMREFAKQLREMAQTLDPKDLEKLMKGQVTMAPDLFFESSMKALASVVSKAEGSTVEVLIDGEVAALGTVVSKDGWVLTKDTETKEGEIMVKFGDASLEATLVQRFPQRDLVLLSVEAEGLKPVRWAKGQREKPLGSLLTAAGPGSDPLGIGLVSVKTRALAGVGFLGIRTSAAKDGVKVEQAVDDGAAAKAGLKSGDVILEINGEEAGEPQEFGQKVRGYRAGDAVTLKLRSGEKTREVTVTLGERPARGASGRFQRMNEMSGPMSERLSGFPEALQHDIPLDPAQCGGPLLDLGGRAVGINVSRAGRVKTLAIPARDVKELLASVKVAKVAEAAPTKEEEAPVMTAEDLEAIEKLLEEVRDSLEDLEERLEKMEVR